jgi:hypothetical protein
MGRRDAKCLLVVDVLYTYNVFNQPYAVLKIYSQKYLLDCKLGKKKNKTHTQIIRNVLCMNHAGISDDIDNLYSVSFWINSFDISCIFWYHKITLICSKLCPLEKTWVDVPLGY